MPRSIKIFFAGLISAATSLFAGFYLVGGAEVRHFTKSGPVDLSVPNAFSQAFSDPTFSTTYSWGFLTLPGMHWALTIPILFVALSLYAVYLIARSNKLRSVEAQEPESVDLSNVRPSINHSIDPPVITLGGSKMRPLVVNRGLLGLGLLIVLFIIGLIFSNSFPYFQKKPQYNTYEDCILAEIGASQTEAAVVVIRDACRGKFPLSQAEIEAATDSAEAVDQAAAEAWATVNKAAMDAGMAVEGAEESE